MKIKFSVVISALTFVLVASAPQAFAQGVKPVAKPTLDSLQAQVTQLTAAFQAEHTARLAAESAEAIARAAADAAEAATRSSAVSAVTTSLNGLSNTVASHTTSITSIQTSTAALQTTVDGFSDRIAAVETKTQFMDVTGTTTWFSGTNVQIVNGEQLTASTNGLGNLIVGYNEDNGWDRSGSHNLVMGSENGYSSYGGAVIGTNNRITGNYASVFGGVDCTATGYGAVVLNGITNAATNNYATVTGGVGGTASGLYSSVGGGNLVTESRPYGWSVGNLHS